jgi:hypothetical protein
MGRYLPKESKFTRARVEYAWDKWGAMNLAERAPYRRDIDALMRLNNLGEKGAVEIIHRLGIFLNMNEREK